MKLSDHQFEFIKDLFLLLEFIIHVKKYKVTGGWLERNIDIQKILFENDKSKTLKSNHLNKTAIDLNIFIDGKLTYKKEDLQEIGQFWENLNPLNRWGGNFKNFVDTPHFERNIN